MSPVVNILTVEKNLIQTLFENTKVYRWQTVAASQLKANITNI